MAPRRAAARIVLLPTERLAEETAAYDLLVNGLYMGHWAETRDGRAAVTWSAGQGVETETCDGEPERVIAAIGPTIPAFRLELPPK